ncbi:MAG: hypothetical protein V3S64_08035 [bacterium]
MLLFPGGALAHDFKVGFLVPLSGMDAAAGKEAVNGFKLAASERDGHPDEEADGHLGGLDVYLLLVDTNGGRAKALTRIRTLIQTPGLHFLSGRIPIKWMGDIRKMLQQGPTILIESGRLSVRENRTLDGIVLAQAYARKFGSQPGPSARLGYSLARLLDRVVRITGDDASNPARVLAALARAGYR